MIPLSFLPPHLTLLNPHTSPILFILFALLLIAVLVTTYQQRFHRRPTPNQLRQDLERFPQPTPSDLKYTSPSPLLPTQTYTDDLPPPLRTTLHSHSPLLTGTGSCRPWTSADFASHPIIYRRQYFLPPPSPSPPHATPSAAAAAAPPDSDSQNDYNPERAHVRVTEALQYLPPSPQPVESRALMHGEGDCAAQVERRWRRRRTLVFEGLPLAGGDGEELVVVGEGEMKDGDGDATASVGDAGAVAGMMMEADFWARMRGGEVEI